MTFAALILLGMLTACCLKALKDCIYETSVLQQQWEAKKKKEKEEKKKKKEVKN